ncbi:MAG TPA: hypothetical protein VIH22_16335 [Cyclobacteriaceae bacterium]
MPKNIRDIVRMESAHQKQAGIGQILTVACHVIQQDILVDVRQDNIKRNVES